MDTVGEDVTSSRVNSNPKPPEFPLPVGERPLNFSIQTGEEFTFIQEDGALRYKPFARSHSNPSFETNAPGISNFASSASHNHKFVPRHGSEGGLEAAMTTSGQMQCDKELGNKGYGRVDTRSGGESTANSSYNGPGEGSSRGRVSHSIRMDTPHGTGEHIYSSSCASDISLSGYMKLLCSFGGKVLPRPSDGKLRYVGGETRIVKIKRDVHFQELMEKMSTLHEQVPVLKYQLSGEELDALVSVTCDEDLQNMMEEWASAEGIVGSHKLRIFLFSQNDLDVSNGNSVCVDSDYQYVVAVNGLAEPETTKSSVGPGITSVSGIHLDQLISLGNGVEEDSIKVISQSAPTPPSSTDIPLPESNQQFCNMFGETVLLSTNSGKVSHYALSNQHDTVEQVYHENVPHYGACDLYPIFGAQPLDNSHYPTSIKVVTSAPLHEHDQGYYYSRMEENMPMRPSQGLLPPRARLSAPHLDADLKYQEPQITGKCPKKQGGCFAVQQDYPVDLNGQWNKQFDVTAVRIHQAELGDSPRNNDLGGISVSINHPPHGIAPKASACEGDSNSLPRNCFKELPKAYPDHQPSDTLHTCQSPQDNNDTIGGDYCNPFGGAISSHADNNVDSRYLEQSVFPPRGFCSEKLTREQIDSLSRLSKSDDSLNSHFLMSFKHQDAHQQVSIMETDNGMTHADILISQAMLSSCVNPTSEGGILQPQPNKNFQEGITQKMNFLSNQENLEASNFQHVVETARQRKPFDVKSHDHKEFHMPSVVEHDQIKERYNKRSANFQIIEEASLKHATMGIMSESNIMKGKLHQYKNLENGPLELVLGDDHTMSNEGKVETQKCMDNLSDQKEKKGPPSSLYNLEVSETSSPKQQIAVKGSVHESHVVDIQLGTANMVLNGSTTNLTKGLYGMRCGNKERVLGYSPAFAWEADIAESGFQIHASETPKETMDGHKNVDRVSPELLSDLFSKASEGQTSLLNPLRGDEAGLSMNIQNHEPQRWSYFRKLAQDEFVGKDVSLLDQNISSYPHAPIENSEDTALGYDFSPFMGNEIPIVRHVQDLDATIQKDSPVILRDETANLIHELHTSSIAFAPVLDKSTDPLKVLDVLSYSNAMDGEILPITESEYEVGKSDKKNVGGSTFDPSLDDFDIPDLQIIKNSDLEELRELGSGTFGTVYHGKWRGTDVAIKRIKKSCFTGRSSEQKRLTHDFWSEAAILSKLHHPNVVPFYGVVKDGPGGTLATVTEFMVNGSLRHVLQRKDRSLDQRKKLMVAMEAAFGMEYLHSKNIIHFDLKCDNLLVNMRDPHHPICKVADFGLSKIKRNTLVSGGVRGTLPWMAPELLSSKVSEKVDVFSFGIVMWEILTGEEPYGNMHYGAIIGGIVNNTLRPPVPSWCDPEWRKLMEQCWAPDPACRPSFTEIVRWLRVMSQKPGGSGR